MKSRYIVSDVNRVVRRSDAKVAATAMPRQMLILPIVAVLATLLLLIVAL